MRFLRILIVWIVTLALFSLLAGSGSGFMFIFFMYGFVMTIPALIALTVTSLVEDRVAKMESTAALLAVGPVMGLVVPVVLFAIAPNKGNAAAAMPLLFLLTLGAGLLWMASVPLRRPRVPHALDHDTV